MLPCGLRPARSTSFGSRAKTEGVIAARGGRLARRQADLALGQARTA